MSCFIWVNELECFSGYELPDYRMFWKAWSHTDSQVQASVPGTFCCLFAMPQAIPLVQNCCLLWLLMLLSFYTKEVKCIIFCVTENENHAYVCLLKWKIRGTVHPCTSVAHIFLLPCWLQCILLSRSLFCPQPVTCKTDKHRWAHKCCSVTEEWAAVQWPREKEHI